ncbi:Hypothetical_protein [Hexamita inflata]|uniref:Hypothetical_protein n=1 Tax=Hexamita inflata TaxID=28002 RepID=A0AA86RE77_9EUKA|nr:Hypothetical protein HINF_LOCUS59183 [Hexamita inflata]
MRIFVENNAQQGVNVPRYTTLPNDLKEVKCKLMVFVNNYNNNTIRFDNPFVPADVKEQVITRMRLARGAVKEASMTKFLAYIEQKHSERSSTLYAASFYEEINRICDDQYMPTVQQFIKIQVITIEDLTKQKVDLIQQRPSKLHKLQPSIKYKVSKLQCRSPSLKFFTDCRVSDNIYILK